MKYDFDTIISRKDTYSVKYSMSSHGKPEDILPMWVADMDFKTPPCVISALEKEVRHGIFGYPETDKGYFEAVYNWLFKRYNWKTEEGWLLKTPGIVNAIHIAVLALTSPEGGVIIQQPVYHPFAHAAANTGRRLIINELIYENGKYTIDFDDFENKIIQNKAELFILCNPHNPAGRVWTYDELKRLGEICLLHNVLVISDEIHQDFTYPGHKHTVFAGIKPEFADITVTCTAPSKTFNIAGLPLSNIFIKNKELRERFSRECSRCGLSHPGVMGIAACRAAYESGEDWLLELISYLYGNMSYIRDYLNTNIPQVKLVWPEGTYLAWLDFRALGLKSDKLDDFILNKAKLWLNSGSIFGKSGEGFQRLNAACPRSLIEEAMQRLKRAVNLL